MHKSPFRFILMLVPLAALPAACSDAPLKRQQAQLARYQAFAQAPVQRVTYLGSYDGWTALSATDLILWMTPWDPYLIKVSPPCTDLTFARSIGLHSAVAHSVQVGFDFVKVQGWTCRILEIRPIDFRRMQADSRRQTQQAQNTTQLQSAN